MLLGESNAAADRTRGRAQAVMQVIVMGSTVNTNKALLTCCWCSRVPRGPWPGGWGALLSEEGSGGQERYSTNTGSIHYKAIIL